MPISITVVRTKNSAMKRSHINLAIKSAMWRIAFDWHTTYSQFKFTPAAARKYHYNERHTKVIRAGRVRRDKRGRPRAPSGNPLTWSGISKALAKQKTIKASKRRSSVRSPVRAFNWRPPKNPKIDMRWEYTRVLASEERKLSQRERPRLQRQLRGSAAVQRIRIA